MSFLKRYAFWILAAGLFCKTQAVAQSYRNTLVSDAGPLNTGYVENTTQSETSVAQIRGTVVVAYNDFKRFGASAGVHATGVSRSVDGGMSFVPMVENLPLDQAGNGDAGDPVLAARTSFVPSLTGKPDLYLVALRNSTPNRPALQGLRLFTSSDDGATWSSGANPAPAPMNAGITAWVPDRPDMVIDNYPGGKGAMYLISHNVGTPRSGKWLSYSADGGETWVTYNEEVAPADLGSDRSVVSASLVVGLDHSLYVFYTSSRGTEIRMRRVTNFTSSSAVFDPIVRVRNLFNGTLPTGTQSHDMMLKRSDNVSTLGASDEFDTHICPRAAVHPFTGQLYVVYQDASSNPKHDPDIFLTTARVPRPGGNWFWSPGIRVNNDLTTRDQWHPIVAITKPETPEKVRLLVTYYSREQDPNNSLIRTFGRLAKFGSTGQLEWQPPFPISSIATPPVFPPEEYTSDSPFFCKVDDVPRGRAMGDYDWMIADANGFLFTWSDGRLNADIATCTDQPGATAPQMDVYFARINELPMFTATELPSSFGPSAALAISPSSGTVVGYSTSNIRRRRPYQWSGNLPGSDVWPDTQFTQARGIAQSVDFNGNVVGYQTDDSGNFTVDTSFYSGSDGTTTTFPGSTGWSNLRAMAIDAFGSGKVVGLAKSLQGRNRPVAWDYSTAPASDLGSLSGSSDSQGWANAINAFGVIVGASENAPLPAGVLRAFRLPANATLEPSNDLGTLQPGSRFTSEATALNSFGDCVGVSDVASNIKRAFLLPISDSTLRPIHNLGSLGGVESVARGINNHRWVVGNALSATGSRQGFIWIPGRTNLTGLSTLIVGGRISIISAEAINDAGQIAGYGTPPGSTVTRAVLLTPVR